MKAVGQFRALPIEDSLSLVDHELPRPAAGANDLLVRVEAVSVNPADFRVRMRKADDGQFVVLGWDVAGTVIEVGPAVTGFAVGDAVFYAGNLGRPGANSEYHVVDAALVGHRPKSLDAAQAAALPLAALAAWEALFERFGLRMEGSSAGKSLLIVGGAGGVGSLAIQLARLVPGLKVIATASRPESRAWCKQLGAHAVINHFGNMEAELAAAGCQPLDLVLLLNDPDRHFPVIAKMLAPQGAICSIVPFAKPVDMNLIQRKSAAFFWEFMFTRPLFDTPDKGAQGRILNQVAALIDEGRLVSTTTEMLGPINAANLRRAHARLEGGRTVGKLVLAGF